ncbi:hypothetical protein F2Q69_00026584 [Brassica cretica]|uniref:Uncharacterized protein n=1 Tax=Brassica cretica TaxID=69181 RepID=A0A8S9RPW0_BRACR|nr:hypothetical protein F2Q69_00026584 [Brassica cretica]
MGFRNQWQIKGSSSSSHIQPTDIPENSSIHLLTVTPDVVHPRWSCVCSGLGKPDGGSLMGVVMLLLDAKVILLFKVMFIIVLNTRWEDHRSDIQGITSPERLNPTACRLLHQPRRWSFEWFGYNTLPHLLLDLYSWECLVANCIEEVSDQLRGFHGTQATTAMLQLPEPITDTLPGLRVPLAFRSLKEISPELTIRGRYEEEAIVRRTSSAVDRCRREASTIEDYDRSMYILYHQSMSRREMRDLVPVNFKPKASPNYKITPDEFLT